MIKSQLVKRLLNKNPHLIQKDLEKITSIVLEKNFIYLRNEGRVEIRGFGSLSVRKRKSKMEEILELVSVFVQKKSSTLKGLRDRLNYRT